MPGDTSLREGKPNYTHRLETPRSNQASKGRRLRRKGPELHLQAGTERKTDHSTTPTQQRRITAVDSNRIAPCQKQIRIGPKKKQKQKMLRRFTTDQIKSYQQPSSSPSSSHRPVFIIILSSSHQHRTNQNACAGKKEPGQAAFSFPTSGRHARQQAPPVMKRSPRFLHALVFLFGGPALGHLVDLQTDTVEKFLHVAGFPCVELQRPAFEAAVVFGRGSVDRWARPGGG